MCYIQFMLSVIFQQLSECFHLFLSLEFNTDIATQKILSNKVRTLISAVGEIPSMRKKTGGNMEGNMC